MLTLTDVQANSLGIVLVALFNLIGIIWIGRNTRQAAADARQAVEVVKVVEKNTNSMKDALVESTRIAAQLKGQQQERQAGDARKAAEAEGRAEIRKEMRDHGSAAVTLLEPQPAPVPVTDTRTADAAERTADAAEKGADAQVRLADATENAKP